ncbi:MAG: hypothetical protein ACREOS_08725, partial [Candidatus Dormibacteraceae bacterium]
MLLALVGTLGTYLYFRWNGKTTVSATVAVWEPAVVSGPATQQAQLSFAPVAQSYTVAERVVKQLGLPVSAESVQGEVSVKLGKSLVPTLVTPLYIVSVDDRDPKRASQILGAVLDQSRQVFAEMNRIDPSQVDAAFAPNAARLQAQLDRARSDLLQYEQKNDAYDLPARIDSQVALVNGLRQDGRSIASGKQGDALIQEKQNLADAQKRLDQLRALQPENDRLTFNVRLASDAVEQLGALRNNPASPTEAQAQALVARNRASLNDALNALAAFQKAHAVGDLPSEIGTQTTLVNNLLELKQQLELTKGSTATQD